MGVMNVVHPKLLSIIAFRATRDLNTNTFTLMRTYFCVCSSRKSINYGDENKFGLCDRHCACRGLIKLGGG